MTLSSQVSVVLKAGRTRFGGWEDQSGEVYFFVQRNVETRFVKVRTDW